MIAPMKIRFALLAAALFSASPAAAWETLSVPCVGSFLSTRTATSSVEWTALWSLAVGERKAPSVDFTRDIVVMNAAKGSCKFTRVPKGLAPLYKPTLVFGSVKAPSTLPSIEGLISTPGLFDGSAPGGGSTVVAPPKNDLLSRLKRIDRSATSFDPNAALKDPEPVDQANESKLMFSVQNLNFMKNNEYFNQFADGYTLFGYQLRPTLVYYPNAYTRVAAGAYLMKEFGREGFTTAQPYFNIKLAKNGYTGTFGNLEGSLNHNLIDPIYDFERVLTNRQEYGIQFQSDKKYLSSDVWMDWQRAIHRNDPYNEMFTFGASLRGKLPPLGKGWTVELPLQSLIWHQGGQIQGEVTGPDQSLGKTTIWNSAAGISVQKTFPRGFVKAVRTEGYLAYYKDLVRANDAPFWQGSGIYLNQTLATKLVDLSAAYWHGNGWIAPEGAPSYNSASSILPGVAVKNRGLVVGRVSRQQKIGRGVTAEVRFEPYYDLNTEKLDYSYAIYLVYHLQEYLARAKH